MTGILRWEDPPPATRNGNRLAPRSTDWYTIAAQLRARPGTWAAVCVGDSTTLPSWIRSARFAAFKPAGAFDAVGRRLNGQFTVYARYVGGES